MKKVLTTAFQYVIFLGLGIFLIWWSTRSLSPDEIRQLKEALNGAKYLLVLPAMVMLLLSHYSRALRWKILMEPLGFQPGNTNTFMAVLLGYFFNLLVPRMGEVMKCTVLARYEKTPVDKLIGTMVAERALDAICLLFVIILTFVLQMDLAGTVFSGEFDKLLAGLNQPGKIPLVLALLVVGAVAVWLFIRGLRKFGHLSVVAGVARIASGIWQGLTSIRLIKRKGAFVLHTLFIWAMYFLSIRVGFYAMEPVSHLGFSPSLTILSVGSLAMIVTQGGIGAYQLAVEKSLSLYGISAVNGLAFGWLLWAFQTILILIAGIICLILLPIINRNKA